MTLLSFTTANNMITLGGRWGQISIGVILRWQKPGIGLTFELFPSLYLSLGLTWLKLKISFRYGEFWVWVFRGIKNWITK